MIAVYAGSFDPITNGHKHIVKRAANEFDLVIVAIATNFGKKHMLSSLQRVELAKDAFKQFPNVLVKDWSYRIIPLWARIHKSRTLIRGIRNQKDLQYEQKLSRWNILYGVINRYFNTIPELENVSSSIVREAIKNQKWEEIEKLVPNATLLQTMMGKISMIYEVASHLIFIIHHQKVILLSVLHQIFSLHHQQYSLS